MQQLTLASSATPLWQYVALFSIALLWHYAASLVAVLPWQ
jgi:hypothetical protein